MAKKNLFKQVVYEAEDILSTGYMYEIAVQCVEATWLDTKGSAKTPKRLRDLFFSRKNKLVLDSAKEMSRVFNREFFGDDPNTDSADNYSIAAYVLVADYLIENDM